MSQADTELALRRLLAAIKKRSAAQASTAVDGVFDTIDSSIDGALAEHAAKSSGVHGVGPGEFVAKSTHPSHFPRWADIREKPDFLNTDPLPGEGDDEHLTPFISLDWLPVAGLGETSSEKLVRADDPRLSDRPQRLNSGEGMGAGWYICVFDDGGVTRVSPATAADVAHAAVAFIIDSIGVHEDVDVYFGGVNPFAQLTTTPAAADVGKTVFLSTIPGYVSLTPPRDPGQLLQPIGRIIEVVSQTTVRVLTAFETQFYL